jgi:hypothetical protein
MWKMVHSGKTQAISLSEKKAHNSQEMDWDVKVTHLFTGINYIIPSSKFLQLVIKKNTAK